MFQLMELFYLFCNFLGRHFSCNSVYGVAGAAAAAGPGEQEAPRHPPPQPEVPRPPQQVGGNVCNVTLRFLKNFPTCLRRSLIVSPMVTEILAMFFFKLKSSASNNFGKKYCT